MTSRKEILKRQQELKRKLNRERVKKGIPIELTTGDAIVAFDPFHNPDWGWTL